MCGIAGFIHPSSLRSDLSYDELIKRLAQSLFHRGPDDSGHWLQPPDNGPSALLLHQRLSIQDISEAGHQPMHSECGRYVLVFNGEIYNQRELRSRLEARGYRFRSSGDTEVLLALLSYEGRSALSCLRGMFAFCLWDRVERTALLARDPYGIKPLYFWHGSGGDLLFASELRALIASGIFDNRLNNAALSAFLCSGSVPEPLTFVDGVYSLPPGHCALLHDGLLVQEPFWTPTFSQLDSIKPLEAVERCRNALEQSVKAHLLSDVPLGLFLSGGLDSAAVLALAPRGLKTLTIGFPQASHDESARAAALASQFGSHHISLNIDAKQAFDFLPGFLASMDQPTVDGFNSYCVSALASQHGLKVVLSGLGGDELFGGYPSFTRIPRMLRWHNRLGSLRPLFANLLKQRHSHRTQRLSSFLNGPASADAAHRCQRGLFSPTEVFHLLKHWQYEVVDLPEFSSTPSFITLADEIAWLESSHYMGQQLLRDSDVFSMAHGLELRLPLVDAQLLEQLMPIPAVQRLASGKQLLQESVPEILERLPLQKKQGFSFPFQSWFEQPDSPMRPGDALQMPSTPPSLDLSPWARRWSLIVLRHWLQNHLGLELPLAQLE
ncbi:asparagine synthase (glutamine-hydrolyzing) [Synechococcus sp. AH-736-G20]|nr:asparagine synthase (glutamine-hydrolyzing) [Synechococcus sp. AH-736-G20]